MLGQVPAGRASANVLIIAQRTEHDLNAHVTKGPRGRRPGGDGRAGRHRGAARPSRRHLGHAASTALQATIDDLEHPPSTAAQLRVGGTAGYWRGTSGVADIWTQRPVTPQDEVGIGSITKAFVAMVVLQLVAEGRVDLDTPVRRILPELLPARFAAVTRSVAARAA
ncbi:beta-lactamase family protein [Streptomyces sp. PRKS01-29]|nr:beta-lactamase family protein [Streptomyces sabulosicollis]